MNGAIKKTPKEVLKDSIFVLQQKQNEQLFLLKEQLHFTYESLKPINIIKNTWKEAISSPEIKDGLLNNIIGLTTGFISKKILWGKSSNPLKQILGTLFEFGVAKFTAKHPEGIKSAAEKIYNKIFKAKEESIEE
jgi:hypothetical protein